MHKENKCDTMVPDRKRYRCPVCKTQTLLFLREDTQVRNLPVKCKTCKREIIVNIPSSLRH